MGGIEAGTLVPDYQTRQPFNRSDYNESPRTAAISGGYNDQVTLENHFDTFLSRVQTLFSEAGEGNGSSGRAYAEFSVRAQVERTFEASYSGSGNIGSTNGKVSAYVKESHSFEMQASFKAAQAEQVAQAHVAALQGNRFGPEATAQRIADFALSFFPMFAAEHPDMSFDEQVEAYQSMVEGAVDDGFGEAMQMLGALPDSVMEGIEETKKLVDEKLSSFFDYLKDEGAESGQNAAENGVWKDYVREFYESVSGT